MVPEKPLQRAMIQTLLAITAFKSFSRLMDFRLTAKYFFFKHNLNIDDIITNGLHVRWQAMSFIEDVIFISKFANVQVKLRGMLRYQQIFCRYVFYRTVIDSPPANN